MIETLRIANLAIVDRAELEFGPGLNVVTGETGAGKSVVLGALALLAGRRASSLAAREGAREASVEAAFRTEGRDDLEAELERRGLAGDAHELLVRRALRPGGRSRAQVSGQLVPVATLAELFAGRIEISSQHDSQALLRAETHGELLDRKGGLLELRRAVAQRHAELRALDAEAAALREAERDRAQRADFLGFQVREIDEAGLDAEEVEALRTERSRLAHAERIRVEGGAALALLSGDPAADDGFSAGDALADAARRLAELARVDPELGALGERLAEAAADVRDAAGDLERHLDRIEADPSRLAAADERLHRVEQLQRKYGAGVDEVLAHRERAAAELAALEGADERAARLAEERAACAGRLEDEAARLSKGRRRAAKQLAASVQETLRELAMPDARFEVELAPAVAPEGLPCGPGGLETPEFVFSANRGEPLRPLRQVASGGELSRAFLAVKQALRSEDAGMVLVFDEVDAGIGGEAADRIGTQLAELAAHHQVLCITHLPQIAAYAATHFKVEKSTRRGRAAVRIERIEGDARIEEIARMAAGESAGGATREFAAELLSARAPESP